MTPRFLGEFEQMVMLSVLRLGDGAYGLRIGDELDDVTGRKASSGSLYTTLDRLESKGLLESRVEETAAPRRGRPRRYYSLTVTGREDLEVSRQNLARLWEGVEETS